MQLSRPFLRLPVRFSAERLAQEINALPADAWIPHPDGTPGNDAVVLISPGGAVTNDASGAMAMTGYLEACPYIQALMKELGAVWGRSRLMGLGAGAEVPLHVDVHYYWRTHLRVHIPIITNPDVSFTCGGETVHMEPGECWVFDTFKPHQVLNGGDQKRVHLVLDTVGGGRMPELIDAAAAGQAPPPEPWSPGSDASHSGGLAFEQVNLPIVMSPWEIRCHINFVAEHAPPSPALNSCLKALDRFVDQWHAAWGRYGTSDAGARTYQELVRQIRDQLTVLGGNQIVLSNGQKFAYTLEALVFWNAVAREPERLSASTASTAVAQEVSPRASSSYAAKFDRPIFIVSSPRSGSTMLFETVARAPGLYSPGGESHTIIEGISSLSVPAKGWESNRLTADDADPSSVEQLARAFYLTLRDRDGNQPTGSARMLEKTPKNSLRVPFLDRALPGGTFLYLYRDVRRTLASMMEAWVSGRFVTYPQLPGWTGYPWSLLLVPGWRDLIGKPLPEIVARQWATATHALLDDLEKLPRKQVRAVDYDRFISDPDGVMGRLAKSLDIDWDQRLPSKLPLSAFTVSPPDPEKWRRLEGHIEAVFHFVADADERARRFLAQFEEMPVA